MSFGGFGSTPTATGGFGAAAAPSAGGFSFGGSSAAPAFGGTSSFGAAAPAGGAAPAFGSTTSFGSTPAASSAPAASSFSFGGAAGIVIEPCVSVSATLSYLNLLFLLSLYIINRISPSCYYFFFLIWSACSCR